jgi:hypothetical protein
VDIEESLHWHRRAADLGAVASLEHLGLCYEKGIVVRQDLREAVRLYERAAALGGRAATFTLGLFHLRGLAGYAADQQMARKLWEKVNFLVPELQPPSKPSPDPGKRSPPLVIADEEPATVDRLVVSPTSCGSEADRSTRFLIADEQPATVDGLAVSPQSLGSEADRSAWVRDSRTFEDGPVAIGVLQEPRTIGDAADDGPRLAAPMTASVPLEASRSFELWNAEHVLTIDSIVTPDDTPVREYFGRKPPITELLGVASEGIRREGARCLHGPGEALDGLTMSQELRECTTVESGLRLCARLYTRNTFLYRRVNSFLRGNSCGDVETARNLGVYIGLLRECFCVQSAANPLPWESRPRLFRGANLSLDVVVDYARRPGALMRWQNFGSSTPDPSVAKSFPGDSLFQIFLGSPVPSLAQVSAFPQEAEVIMSPYRWFSVHEVTYDLRAGGRYMISIVEEEKSSVVESWLFPDS